MPCSKLWRTVFTSQSNACRAQNYGNRGTVETLQYTLCFWWHHRQACHRFRQPVCVCVQDMDTGAGSMQLPPGEQVVTQHVVLPPRVQQLLQEHTAFLHQQGDMPAMFACSMPTRQRPEKPPRCIAVTNCLLDTASCLCILLCVLCRLLVASCFCCSWFQTVM